MAKISAAIDLITIIAELTRSAKAVDKAMLPDGTVPQAAWKEQQYLEAMAKTHRDEVYAAMPEDGS